MRSHAVRWVALAALLWSSGGLFIKLLPASGPAVAFGRAVVTSLFYLAVLRPDLRRARWSTGLVYAGMIVTFVIATKLTTAANAIFLQYTGPAYVLLLAPLLLGEPFERRDAVAVAVSLAGMALVFVGRASPGQTVGNLIGLASGVFFALAIVLMRRDSGGRDGDPVPSVTLGNLIAVVGLLPWAWHELPALVTPSSIALFLYLGVVQMGLAYLCFARGLRGTTAATASLVAMLEPVLNPLWVYLGTGERPSGWALVGGGGVVVAIGVRSVRLAGGSGGTSASLAPNP